MGSQFTSHDISVMESCKNRQVAMAIEAPFADDVDLDTYFNYVNGGSWIPSWNVWDPDFGGKQHVHVFWIGSD